MKVKASKEKKKNAAKLQENSPIMNKQINTRFCVLLRTHTCNIK